MEERKERKPKSVINKKYIIELKYLYMCAHLRRLHFATLALKCTTIQHIQFIVFMSSSLRPSTRPFILGRYTTQQNEQFAR